ncbi:hypothetical protein K1719_007873 [Acacia pycnantha]|nr:hypothetical protein K1719_007873 [Acacia pycnantha]
MANMNEKLLVSSWFNMVGKYAHEVRKVEQKMLEIWVVTNSTTARTSIAYFVFPSNESVIEPAQVLFNEAISTTPKYRSITYAEFRRGYFNKGANLEPDLLF